MAEHKFNIPLSTNIEINNVSVNIDDQVRKEIEKKINGPYNVEIGVKIESLEKALASIQKKTEGLKNLEIIDANSLSNGEKKLNSFKKSLSGIEKIYSGLETYLNDSSKTIYRGIIDNFDNTLQNFEKRITNYSPPVNTNTKISKLPKGLLEANKLIQERIALYKEYQNLSNQKSILETNPTKNSPAIDTINKSLEQCLIRMKELKSNYNDFVSAKIIDKNAFKEELDSLFVSDAVKKQELQNKRSDSILSKFDSSLIADLDKATDKVGEYYQEVEKVKNAWAELQNYIKNNDLTDPNINGKAKAMAKELQNSLKLVTSDKFDLFNGKGEKYLGAFKGNIGTVKDEIENLIRSLGRVDEATIQWAASQKSVSYSMQDTNGVMKRYRANLETIGDSIQVRQVELGQESFSIKLGRYLNSGIKTGMGEVSKVIDMYTAMEDLIRYVSKGIDIFKEYDAALTDISYTTEGTKAQIDAMGESYAQLAKDISASVSDAMEVASIYANLQTSQEEVMQSVRPTLLLSNATGVGASDASDQIQGVLEQFDMATSQSEHIVDVYESISSNLKLDFGKFFAA